MEQLKAQLEAHEAAFSGEEEVDSITQASQKWASHCLGTYEGELLKRGLAVAQALSEFGGEFYHEAKDKLKGKTDVD